MVHTILAIYIIMYYLQPNPAIVAVFIYKISLKWLFNKPPFAVRQPIYQTRHSTVKDLGHLPRKEWYLHELREEFLMRKYGTNLVLQAGRLIFIPSQDGGSDPIVALRSLQIGF